MGLKPGISWWWLAVNFFSSVPLPQFQFQSIVVISFWTTENPVSGPKDREWARLPPLNSKPSYELSVEHWRLKFALGHRVTEVKGQDDSQERHHIRVPQVRPPSHLHLLLRLASAFLGPTGCWVTKYSRQLGCSVVLTTMFANRSQQWALSCLQSRSWFAGRTEHCSDVTSTIRPQLINGLVNRWFPQTENSAAPRRNSISSPYCRIPGFQSCQTGLRRRRRGQQKWGQRK